jgi:serine/threonine protein kinase
MEFQGDAEILRHDADFTLCRGIWDLDGSRVLALRATTKDLAPSKVDRLYHEYALRDELTAAGALRPRALLRGREGPTLILEDPGGELLARGTGRPWDLRALLRVAIGIGAALGRLHERGLIHKDVKPGNVFADFTSGTAWLTGFGIASRLPRERRVPEPPEIIAGTLAYMAPEQTGRMNRSLDSRGDLYALGVTLYELLTGRLPFNARDASEWVHCHIARQPTHPRELTAGLDEGVCGVVLKLLAKSADERYQTAAGLVADLRRCLEALESTGRIEPFSLGRTDPSDRLHMPGKLYGRERESNLMLEAFARVARTGAPEVVLVSGYSGAGKSSVILELQKTIVPPQGFFASGKVDQYKRDMPYAALAEALSKLVRQVRRTKNERACGRRCDDSSACSPARAIRSCSSSTICNGSTRRPSNGSHISSRTPTFTTCSSSAPIATTKWERRTRWRGWWKPCERARRLWTKSPCRRSRRNSSGIPSPTRSGATPMRSSRSLGFFTTKRAAIPSSRPSF